jgi:hypothetical protein
VHVSLGIYWPGCCCGRSILIGDDMHKFSVRAYHCIAKGLCTVSRVWAVIAGPARARHEIDDT